MMIATFVLLIAGVVSATVGSEPERVLPAEVATKSPSEAPPYSSGQEGSATKEPSSQKESPPSSSGEQQKESLRYGSSSSSSGGPVGQNKEEAKELQAVLHQQEV